MSPPMVDIKVDKKSFRGLYDWLGKLEETALSTDVMDVGVKYIGRAIDHQFKSEGTATMGGKWRQLSAMTKIIRKERGYPEAHPILRQSGDLQDATAGTLRSWGIGTKRATVSADGIRMVAWTGRGKFTAKISGAKVQNQYGGKTLMSFYPEGKSQGGESSDLPARPFFGLTQAGVIEARDEMLKKIMRDWARKSGSNKVI